VVEGHVHTAGQQAAPSRLDGRGQGRPPLSQLLSGVLLLSTAQHKPGYTPDVPQLYLSSTQAVPQLYPDYTSAIPRLYPGCNPTIPQLYLGYTPAVPQLYPSPVLVLGWC